MRHTKEGSKMIHIVKVDESWLNTTGLESRLLALQEKVASLELALKEGRQRIGQSHWP